MPLTVKVRMSGLIAYARHEDASANRNTIDALLVTGGVPSEPAAAHGGHGAHGGRGGHAGHEGRDAHVAALSIPTSAVFVDSSAPDYIIDGGEEEYAVWRLEGTVVDALIDGRPSAGTVSYTARDLTREIAKEDPDNLQWLPSISRAAGFDTTFRADCLPPAPNPRLVSCAVRIRDGKARALWSVDDHKNDSWMFKPPSGTTKQIGQNELPEYRQALADGLEWTIEASHSIEFLLRTDGRPVRSIQIVVGEERPSKRQAITACITNKASTVGGGSVFGPVPTLAGHFECFYELVEPMPGMRARRVPVAVAHVTKANRCPGTSA